MLFLVLAGVCLVILVGLVIFDGYNYTGPKGESFLTALSTLLILGIAFLAVMGCTSSSGIYGERVYEKSRVLVTLDPKQEYYLNVSDKGKAVNYSYDKVLSEKSYTVYYIPENDWINQEENVVEISIEEIAEPVCEVYYQKCLPNSWTFAWGQGRYVYVFRVPQGTVFSNERENEYIEKAS